MAGLGTSQFRESAIIRNAQPEPLDDRAQLTAPREWAVLAGLGLVLAVVAVWGAFGSVERIVRADGVLVLSGERRLVRSGASGAVAGVLAQAGERVTAGQAIARIAVTGMERPVRLAAASTRLPGEEAKGAAAAGRTEAQALLASARAVLDELAALREGGEVVSPGDGVIAAVLATPGQTIVAGAPVAELVSGDDGRLDAVAFVPRRDAWPLAPGMAARVTVESPQGVRSLPAELTAIEARGPNPPGWLARMRPGVATPGQGHLLRLTISDPAGRALPSAGAPGGSLDEGTPCRIEIVHERTSPFGLLIKGRGGRMEAPPGDVR